jgi:hypothetical protein
MSRSESGVALRGGDKLARIPVKVDRARASPPKPSWLRADPGTPAPSLYECLLFANARLRGENAHALSDLHRAEVRDLGRVADVGVDFDQGGYLP